MIISLKTQGGSTIDRRVQRSDQARLLLVLVSNHLSLFFFVTVQLYIKTSFWSFTVEQRFLF
jgi:hypothetical protein